MENSGRFPAESQLVKEQAPQPVVWAHKQTVYTRLVTNLGWLGATLS